MQGTPDHVTESDDDADATHRRVAAAAGGGGGGGVVDGRAESKAKLDEDSAERDLLVERRQYNVIDFYLHCLNSQFCCANAVFSTKPQSVTNDQKIMQA